MDTSYGDSESETVRLISAMYPEVGIENDPHPYECEEGYDGFDPQYPDRRWRLRVERPPMEFPEPPQNDTRHTCATPGEQKKH